MNHSLSTTLLHSTDHHHHQQQQQSISPWSNLSNATSSPFTPPERNISLVSIEIAVQCLIFLVAVIGNMRVAVLLHRSRTVGTGPTRAARNDSERESVVKIERGPVEEEKKTKRRKMTRLSRMNYMMAHLTAADLFVAFFNVLPQLLWDITGKFQGNDVICRSVTHLQLVAMYASSYVLVATGLDRHSAICRPFNSITWSARRSKILVSAAWLLAFIFALPQVFIFSYRWDSRGSLNCWAVFQPPWTMRVYVVWVALSIYAIPVAILLVTYTLLCRAVWTSFQTGVDPGRRAERKKFSLTSLTSSFRSNSTKTSSLLRGRRPFLKNHFRSRTVEQLEKIERANGLEMEVLIPLGNQEIKKRQQQQQQQQHQQQQAPPFIASVVTFKLPEKSLESDRRLSGHFHRNAKVPTAGSSGFFGRNSKLKIRSETFTASPNVKSDIDEDLPQTALKQNGKTKSEEEAVKGVLDAGLPDQTKRGFTAVSKKKSQMSRAKIRTVKLTVIINISYLLCWCPFFFSQLWAALDAEAPYESPGMTITTLLASLNSCVNPLIFIFFVHIQRDKKGRVK